MRTFAMTLDLKDAPGVVEQYKQYHRAVWPEVVEALRDIGIPKMKIFLRGLHLFMYMETVDDFEPARDLPRYAEVERAKEWDDLMRTFQQPVPDAAPGEWWAEMEEVFDRDR